MNTAKQITHDSLPAAVQYLTGKVEYLLEIITKSSVSEDDIDWVDLDGIRNFCLAGQLVPLFTP